MSSTNQIGHDQSKLSPDGIVNKGYIHLYTGNGKGKTTAALGLAIRAFGAGKKIFIGQFVKGMPYSELDTIKQFLPGITLKQFGLGCFIKDKPTNRDIEVAKEGLNNATLILRSNEYDVVILDELCIALYFKLLTVDEVVKMIKAKPYSTELVLTGRYAPQEIIDIADLVTEMKEVKHYYTTGVEARKGIEY